MKQPTEQQKTYEAPRIEHQGQLKQFSGSPLGGGEAGNPLGLPGGE